MTAVWLLPVVAAEVAAASGGLLAPYLAGAHAKFFVLILSYVLWAYSVPVALGILAILVLRMALYKLPPRSMAASSWLALGPLGTGALGLILLGGDARVILGARGMAEVGAVAQGIGLIGGILLWGYGLWWLLLAALITIGYFGEKVPFNLGWWGYIFPLGVYTAVTLKLGVVLDIGLFSVIGAVLALALGTMWIMVAARTVQGGWRGNLFVSPCIATPL